MAEYQGQTTFHFCSTLQGHSADSFMCRSQHSCNFWLLPRLAWCYMNPGVRWLQFAAAVVHWFYRNLKGRHWVVSLISIMKSSFQNDTVLKVRPFINFQHKWSSDFMCLITFWWMTKISSGADPHDHHLISHTDEDDRSTVWFSSKASASCSLLQCWCEYYVKLLDVQEQNHGSVCWSNNQPIKCSAAVGVLCCLTLGSLVHCYYIRSERCL